MMEKNGNSNSVMGAALMGAVAGAAAVVLMNKDTRENIKKSLAKSLEIGEEKLHDAQEKATKLKGKMVKKTTQNLEAAKRKLEQTI